MALARVAARPQSLGQLFGLEPEPGQVPSGVAFNDYLASIPPTNEQQREAGVLAEADARAEAGIRRDLEEAEAVRSARSRGFSGSYPLQEQANYEANQKLRQVLIPKQMELESAALERETGREFNAAQSALDRQSRERIASGAQATQLDKTQATQQGIAHRQAMDQWNKRIAPRKLYDWFAGTQAPQAPTGQAGADEVLMMDPNTGETRPVPSARVNEMLARGAQIVN